MNYRNNDLIGSILKVLLELAPTTFGLPAAALAQPAAAAAAPAAFTIEEYQVEGNTVLGEVEIDRAIIDHLGPGKTSADVEAARAALEAVYSKHGYPTVSVEVPVQHVIDGVVVLKVVERPVGRLRVKDSQYYALAPIRRAAPSLAEGTVPDMAAVQRDIVGLNQWPGRAVVPVLKAGAAPDTVDVDLKVQDQLPLHASLELNDRRSADTKPLRVLGSVGYDNLWQRGDSASVSVQLAPQRPADAPVMSASYLYRIPNSAMSVLASYVHSDSAVSTLGSTNVIGKGDIAGLRLMVPLGNGDGFVHTLSAGMDYKSLQEREALGSSQTSAPVRYFPITVTYQASWSGNVTQADLATSLVMNPRGIGSNAAAFDNKRYDAQRNFIYVRTNLDATQALPEDLQLYANVTAQLAGDPLVSSEEFSLGGLDTVRGYLESEALGDYGGALQTELRTPALAAGTVPFLTSLRGFAFFDIGATAIRNPLPAQTRSNTMYSTGTGVRLQLFDHLSSDLIGAVPLVAGPNTRPGSGELLFRIQGAF